MLIPSGVLYVDYICFGILKVQYQLLQNIHSMVKNMWIFDHRKITYELDVWEMFAHSVKRTFMRAVPVFCPKVLNWVGVSVLCRPLDFLHLTPQIMSLRAQFCAQWPRPSGTEKAFHCSREVRRILPSKILSVTLVLCFELRPPTFLLTVVKRKSMLRYKSILKITIRADTRLQKC